MQGKQAFATLPGRPTWSRSATDLRAGNLPLSDKEESANVTFLQRMATSRRRISVACGQQISLMHGLRLGEGDLGDLSGDLAPHQDDGHRRRRCWGLSADLLDSSVYLPASPMPVVANSKTARVIGRRRICRSPAFDLAQQPTGDDVTGNVALTPGVIKPPPVPVAGHGVAEMLGPATGAKGLIPAFPSSVEPSGIVPLPVADPATVPGVDGVVPEAVPPVVEEPPHTPDVADVDELAMDELEDIPPPSKFELKPATPPPLSAGVDDPMPKQGLVLPVASSGPGLMPPGISSVEPKGIPLGPAGPLVPGTPKGDVAPIPGSTF
jgi:hypothetical protein